MNIYPSIEEAAKIRDRGGYKRIPVSTEFLSDFITPVEALKILKNVSSHVFMLESARADEHWGRYTFLGYEPQMAITCSDHELKVGDLIIHADDPTENLRQILSEYKSPIIEGMPPFAGGLVGYFSYDHIKYAEKTLKLSASDEEGFKDFDLMLFDTVIAFDNVKQKIVLIKSVPLSDLNTGYKKAEMDFKNIIDLLRNGEKTGDTKGRLLSEVRPLFEKEEYCEMVEKAKHYIHEGDIFQIVLSNRLSADYEGSLLDTYRVLRTINPSPYMFYLSGTDVEVAGASPETLVKLEDGVLHTFPLAGTRPRGKSEEEDNALTEELLSDEKELAEHNMLVDLGRNDLGKISRFGSVEVEKFHSIEKFSHVMHIGSTVRGEIAEGYDALDAISAVLPAGTLSGAPKIRACELIDMLEANKRGIYGGAIGYIDFAGNMDTCIAIRIAYKKNGKVFIRSGAGIVADSVPEKEYAECINKAKAVVRALETAGEMEE